MTSGIITRGAYHLTENFGNSGWKVNGKVTFRKFQPKIEEYVLRQSFHSGCLLGRLPLTNFSVPSQFHTHATQICPFFGFKPKRIWHFYGKLANRLPLCFQHPNRIFLSNGKHPRDRGKYWPLADQYIPCSNPRINCRMYFVSSFPFCF